MKAITCITILAMLVSCLTVRLPDGTTTTSVDLDTTIAIAQLTFDLAQQGLELWDAHQAINASLDEAEYQRGREERVARIAELRALLADLYALRASEPEPTRPITP